MILCLSKDLKNELPKDTQQMLYVYKRLKDNKGQKCQLLDEYE